MKQSETSVARTFRGVEWKWRRGNAGEEIIEKYVETVFVSKIPGRGERCKKFVSGTGMLRSTIKFRPFRVSFLALFPIRLVGNAGDLLLNGTEPGSIVHLSQLCAPNQLATWKYDCISMRNEIRFLFIPAPRIHGVSKMDDTLGWIFVTRNDHACCDTYLSGIYYFYLDSS